MGLPREPSKQAPSDSDVQTEDSGKQEGKPEVRTSNRLTSLRLQTWEAWSTAVQATVVFSKRFVHQNLRGALHPTEVSFRNSLSRLCTALGQWATPRHAPHRRCQHFNGSKSGRLVANCLNSIQSIPGISHTWPISKKSWRIFRIRYKVTPVTC